MKFPVIGCVAALMIAASGQAFAQETLNVFWVKGFYKSEDDALFEAVRKFEQKIRHEGRAVAVCGSGHDPEDGRGARFRHAARRRLCRRLRFPGHRQVGLRGPARGHLRRHRADEGALCAEHRSRRPSFYNDKTKKRAYYAFPLKQQTMHIEYWIDMLEAAGFKESDVPKTWKEYWSFWCDKVQPAYRKATGSAQLRHRPAARRRLRATRSIRC